MMSHQDASRGPITKQRAESSWFIRTTHHDASSRLVMMHHDDSSLCITNWLQPDWQFAIEGGMQAVIAKLAAGIL